MLLRNGPKLENIADRSSHPSEMKGSHHGADERRLFLLPRRSEIDKDNHSGRHAQRVGAERPLGQGNLLALRIVGAAGREDELARQPVGAGSCTVKLLA